MIRLFPAALLAVLVAGSVAAAGCGDDGNDHDATNTPAVTATPTVGTSPTTTESPTPTPGTPAPAGFHEWPVDETGEPAIDTFLTTLGSGDATALAELAGVVSTPCTTATIGIPGEPPCPSGVADGTPVDAFLQASCQPNFVIGLDAAAQATARLAETELFVYAAYEGGLSVGTIPPAFTVVLGTTLDRVARRVLLDGDGSVIGLISCNPPVQSLTDDNVSPGDARLLLAPVEE